MGVSMSLQGADAMIARLDKVAIQTNVELATALYREGEAIMADTLPITPIETGTLRSSGHVEAPELVGPGTYEVKIGFGGAASDYALIVHERLDVTHEAPTQAKFLETTMNHHAKDFAARLAVMLRTI